MFLLLFQRGIAYGIDCMKFEWDDEKNKENARKHGVRFEDACYVFADVYGLSKHDDEHSETEDRWILLACSPLTGKILVVIHTYRECQGQESVRIISARPATRHERNAYQKRAKQ
jgi:uncharacterized DUF497 family protein